MFTRKLDEGKKGEDLAEQYLKKKGFEIIERNFRIRGGEIDIIAIDQDTLVFVEVKTRSSNEFGTPLEAITPWKLRSVIKTAEFYKLIHPKLPDAMRIDAVSVTIDRVNNTTTISLEKNIS